MFSTTDLNPLSKVTSITQLFSVTGLDGSFAALLTFSIGRDVLDHLPNFQFFNVSQLGMLGGGVDDARERKHPGYIWPHPWYRQGFSVWFFFVHWF